MLKYTQKWREKYADLPGSPQVALSQQDPPNVSHSPLQ